MVTKIWATVKSQKLGSAVVLCGVLALGGCAPMPLQQNLANFNTRNIPFYLYSPVYTQIRPGAWFGSGAGLYEPSGPYFSDTAPSAGR